MSEINSFSIIEDIKNLRHRIERMETSISDTSERLARIEERDLAIKARQEEMKKMLESMMKVVVRLERYANQGRGAIFFAMGAGAFITWCLAQWDGLKKLFL